MGRTSKTNKPPGKDDVKSGKSPPTPVKRDYIRDEDIEDGDIATPKRDREGEDDQPL